VSQEAPLRTLNKVVPCRRAYERESRKNSAHILSVLQLPQDMGGCNLTLCVSNESDKLEVDGEVVDATIDLDGAVRHDPGAASVADVWLRGDVSTWVEGPCGSDQSRLQIGGASDLAESCLTALRHASDGAPARPAPTLG
jgi:hypothetical protein